MRVFALLFVAFRPSAALRSGAELLSLVNSELRPNRYLCSPQSAQRIEEACNSLIDGASARPAFPRDLMVLNGRWRLVYSSVFGAPVAPPDALQSLLPLSTVEGSLPLFPRDVYQNIDVVGRRVVNEVAIAPFPVRPAGAELLSSVPGLGSVLATLREATVTLELDHSFSVDGEGGSGGGARRAAAGSLVEVRLESVRRALGEGEGGGDGDGGGDDGWVDMLNPQVRAQVRRAATPPGATLFELPEPLRALASGAFDTPYADGRVRISRGVGGPGGSELRIFEREGGEEEADSRVYATWQEEEDALAAAAAAGDGEAAPGSTSSDRWQEGGLDEAEAMDFYEPGADGMPDS